MSRPKSPATRAAMAAARANPGLTLAAIAIAHHIHRVTLCRALAGDRCPACGQVQPRGKLAAPDAPIVARDN